MFSFFVIAFRNIVKNRTRSLILGTAIMLISVVLTLLMSVTSGVEDTMLKTSTTLMTGHVNVSGFYKISMSSAAPVITDLTPLYDITRQTVGDEAVLIVDRVKGWGKIISDTSSLQAPMWGIDINTETDVKNSLRINEGDLDAMKEPGGIAIFEFHAKKLGVKAGDTVTVSMPTYRNINNTKDLRVVAVMHDVGLLSQFSVFMHKKDLREIYQMKEDTSGQIMVYLKSIKKVPEIENRLRKAMADKGYRLMEKESKPFWMKFENVVNEVWTGQKIDITTWTDEISFMEWVIKIFHMVSIIFTLIVLSIVVLGIMNAIWISIKERAAEIGTLRAIGMQKGQVVLMFILEGFTLSALSTATGICLGVLMALFLNWMHIPVYSEAFQHFLLNDYIVFAVKLPNILVSFFVITIFTTSGALYPAYRSMWGKGKIC